MTLTGSAPASPAPWAGSFTERPLPLLLRSSKEVSGMNTHEKRFLKVVCIVVLSMIFIISFTHRDLTIIAKDWKFKVLCDTRGNDISTPRKTCLNDETVK
jgi:hypothetical protein